MKVAIITSSDKGYKNERKDVSGEVINQIVTEFGYDVVFYKILPDEIDMLSSCLIELCDEKKADLILTTGGTGFSKRDVMPEATLKVIDRQANGIAEAMRYNSLMITKRAMLSRAVAGIRKDTLIVNLPGSPKAVRENLEYIIDTLHHGIEILQGKTGECARK